MKISQSDYLVIQTGGTKKLLVKCTHVGDKKFSGSIEKARVEPGSKIEYVDFESSDVVVNLGRSPRIGTAYGVKVEPMVKRLTAGSAWVEVHLYQSLDDNQEATLKSELITISKLLKSLGISGLKHVLEIRQPTGKYAGYHKFQPKGDHDILCVKPEVNLDGLHYIALHEYAHGIWHRMIGKRMRLRWVRLYHEYIKLQAILEDELREVLEEITSASSVRAFMKDCDDQSLMIVKDALRHIKHVHGLTRVHLEMLLEQGEPIEDYWPTALELSEKEVCITEYARKSPEEFFAEAMAFSMSKRLIPKRIQSLVDKTLANLAPPKYTSQKERQ